MNIVISIESNPTEELRRVKFVIQKSAWLMNQGYEIALPIIDDIGKREISDNEFLAQIKKEHHKNQGSINKYKDRLLIDWDKNKIFLVNELRKIYGIEIKNNYTINLTLYGTGGGYEYPNTVIIRVYPKKEGWAIGTLIHEIIHLSVEKLIKDNQIEHWQKERIVDLISEKIFPGKFRLQRDPVHAEFIDKEFKKNFPNIEKIIKNIGENN